MAAEGGGKFGYKDPGLDNRIDHDDSDVRQEVNTTESFDPFGASTPYHGGEQTEMHAM